MSGRKPKQKYWWVYFESDTVFPKLWRDFVFPSGEGRVCVKIPTENWNASDEQIGKLAKQLLDKIGISIDGEDWDVCTGEFTLFGEDDDIGKYYEPISDVVHVESFEVENNMIVNPPSILQDLHTESSNFLISNGILLKYEGQDENVVVPKGVSAIGKEAFLSCENLSSIVLPEGISVIGEGAFIDCRKLSSIVLPEGVLRIEHGAFCSCESLTFVSLPSSLCFIGENSFAYTSLKELSLPQTVFFIGKGAFSYCHNLEKVSVRKDATNTSNHNFKNPVKDSRIGNWAFHSDEKLEFVSIPEQIARIDDSVFEDCSNLSSIVLPERVKRIGCWAFNMCENLKTIFYLGSFEEFAKIYVDNDTWPGRGKNSCFKKAQVFYYSEEKPTEDGNYWHYVREKPTPWKLK